MKYHMHDLPFAPAALSGLSEALISSHYQNNYGGAVTRLNAIRAQLASRAPSTLEGFELNGLKREELIATNSMLLHALYFGNLGGADVDMVPAMALALAANFGSVERWREEFVAMGKALGGGSGWVLLVFQPHDGSLVNQWAADHAHALAGGIPILALDMYEHAYAMDFGAAAARYVDVFMDNILWSVVYERYQHAVHGASEAFGVDPAEAAGAVLLDVRREAIFQSSPAGVAGAQWHNPAKVTAWAQTLDKSKSYVVYCIYGHEVGRSTAMRMRAHGLHARYMQGGLESWKAAGLPMQTVSASVE